MENESDTEQSSSLTEKSVLSSHTNPKPVVASDPNPTSPVLHSSHHNLHTHSHPNTQALHFSGFSGDTAHPHPFRPHTFHPSPLARTSSNSSLCSVLTPEKMKSIISGTPMFKTSLGTLLCLETKLSLYKSIPFHLDS